VHTLTLTNLLVDCINFDACDGDIATISARSGNWKTATLPELLYRSVAETRRASGASAGQSRIHHSRGPGFIRFTGDRVTTALLVG
jgi:hypothetical protein